MTQQNKNIKSTKDIEIKEPVYISFGICWDKTMDFNSGAFYFQKSQMYCNYYPCITDGYKHIQHPRYKCKSGDTLGITLDFKTREVEFIIGSKIIKTEFFRHEKDYSPVFIVGGLFCGKLMIE